MKLVVLGADSWIGSRFVKCAGSLPSLDVVGWAMEKSAGTDFRGAHVYGIENVASAVSGADIVVNLHESQDFSLTPDEKALHHHNVQFVESLISTHQEPGHNWKLIHLSTPLLQCSSRWPNVNGSETQPDEVPSSRPFKAYCSSKQRAEELLKCSTIDCIVVRPVDVYGQGDDCSVITDILKMSSKFGFSPEIGDRDGVTQLMALDNLMLGLWNCVEKLYPDDFEEDESSQSLHCEQSYEDRDLGERVFETILLCDDTEKRPFFENFGDCIPGGKFHIPLLPLYYIYYFVAMIICLFGPGLAKKMPDPDYFYMNFHHWTFFNNFKARQYLEYKPLPSQNELKTSRDYYRSLLPSNITRFSWQTTRLFPR